MAGRVKRWVVYESGSPIGRMASGLGLPIIALRSGQVVKFINAAKRRLILMTTVHSFAFTPFGSANEYFIGYKHCEERGLTMLFKWNLDGALMATRSINNIYITSIQILADGRNLVTTAFGGTIVHYVYSADFTVASYSICQNEAYASPDGTKIALRTDNTICVVDCDMHSIGPMLTADGVIEWSLCSRYLIIGSFDRRMVITDTQTRPMSIVIKPNCFRGFPVPICDTIDYHGPPKYYHVWENATRNMLMYNADGELVDSVNTMGDGLCPSWVSGNVWIELHGRELVACAWRSWSHKWYAGCRPTARVVALAASLPNVLLSDVMRYYVNLV